MLNQSTTTAVLRIAVHSSRSAAIGTKITRATATPAASFSTFSTTSKHASQTVASRPICLFQTRTTTSNNARTRRLPGAPQPRGCTLSPILKQARFASTSSTATSTSATSPNTTEPSDQTLTWNQFFTLRKTRRRIQVIFSLLGAVGCGAAGSFTLATGLAEPLVTLIPLDPFITMGLMAFASALLGWLLGPSLGGGVFYMWHRRIRPQMTAVGPE